MSTQAQPTQQTTVPPATLTPAQVSAYNKITGLNVPATPVNPAVQSRAAQIQALGAKAAPVKPPVPIEGAPSPVVQGTENFATDTADNAADAFKSGTDEISDDMINGVAKVKADPTLASKAVDTEQTIQHTTGDTLGTGEAIAAAPITTSIKNIADLVSSSPIVQKIALKVPDFGDKLTQLATDHPEIAKNLSDIINIAGAALGGEAADEGTPTIDAAVSTTKNAVSKVADTVVQKAKNIATPAPTPVPTPASTAAADAKNLKNSIDAVNPDLKGKNLVGAYKGVVTGNRDAVPSAIFKEQGLTPDQQTVNLGTRLSDLGLGKNHVQNLKILGNSLTDTENKLTTALRGDPEINYNADKPTLLQNLENAKAPRETEAIKDSKAVFQNVMDFAKEKVNEADDTIEGIRNARTAFDTRAKIEYPSAFKEGSIDTKTPAGQAIRAARDTINAHLYNTAPNGSDIQNLIGREADIFRATDNIAPKASATHGKYKPEVILDAIRSHPYVAGAAGLLTAYEAGRHLPL